MNIVLNNERQHYVISTGNSVSIVGFDVVYEQAREIIRRFKALSESTLLAKLGDALVNLVMPGEDQIGTVQLYSQYQALMAGYSKLDDKATWFDARTPGKVRRALEAARRSTDTFRIFSGDSTTGLDWMDQYDTIGRIQRSNDAMKVPLLVPSGQCGGPALWTSSIVRIINVTKGTEVYRHPNYHLPKLVMDEAASYDKSDGFTHCIKIEKDGGLDTLKLFRSQGKAAHWLAFMNGESHDYDFDE